MLFDGEEATDDSRAFEATGLRGSQGVRAAPRGELRALILLDFVAGKDMRIQREASSRPRPLERAAACRGGPSAPPSAFPAGVGDAITDDHTPFLAQGVPAIDLIEWPYDVLAQALRRPVGGERALARPDGGDGHRARSYTQQTVTAAPEKLLLAAPRGYCAGVDRAVQTVERALELHGPPVYVRKEIVHNKHVVEELARPRRDLRRRARATRSPRAR